MLAQTTAPAQDYPPYADRAGPDTPASSPEWLARWLALLIFFLQEPLNAVRVLCAGRLPSWRFQDRPDLPPGSAQAEAASVRGAFGNSIRWMCLRHGIGPGHNDWPELSRAIVAFGGSLQGFRAGAPPRGLQWWENPGVVPGMTLTPGFGAFAATLPPPQPAVDAAPPVPAAVQAEAAHSRLPASWFAASVRQVFARAGPGSATGPPGCPVLPTAVMSDARGRSMAGPAVLIPANRKSRARPGTAHAFRSFEPLTCLP
jgi:hypothetical protein